MIGIWQKFGEGEPPQEGEVLVYVSFQFAPYKLGFEGKLTPAIVRFGTLQDQDGNIVPVPYGSFWTSLPRPVSDGSYQSAANVRWAGSVREEPPK